MKNGGVPVLRFNGYCGEFHSAGLGGGVNAGGCGRPRASRVRYLFTFYFTFFPPFVSTRAPRTRDLLCVFWQNDPVTASLMSLLFTPPFFYLRITKKNITSSMYSVCSL
jgi:hypothetical protein